MALTGQKNFFEGIKGWQIKGEIYIAATIKVAASKGDSRFLIVPRPEAKDRPNPSIWMQNIMMQNIMMQTIMMQTIMMGGRILLPGGRVLATGQVLSGGRGLKPHPERLLPWSGSGKNGDGPAVCVWCLSPFCCFYAWPVVIFLSIPPSSIPERSRYVAINMRMPVI